MELEVWDGDWGVPTVDHNCLMVVAYCRFANAPVDIKKTNKPWKSPTGTLPVLRHDSTSEADVWRILELLRKNGYNIDEGLTSKQSADTLAFSALLTDKLLPLLLYQWWIDSKVFTELTRPWYGKAVGFPLSLYVPLRRQSEYRSLLSALFSSCVNDNELEAMLVKNAKECLNLLSTRLGDRNFFFGDKPTTLDAVVFGHIAVLLKAPLSQSPLQNHLKACRNLVTYCQRILNDYFPLSVQEQESIRACEEAERRRLADQVDFPHRTRNIVLAGLTVSAVMMTYAVYTGLVHLQFISVSSQPPAGRREPAAEVQLTPGSGDAHD